MLVLVLVLVAGDYEPLADGLAVMLARAGYEVLGPVTHFAEAVRLVTEQRPAIALLGSSPGQEAGSIAIARELYRLREIPSLFVGGHVDLLRSNGHGALGHIDTPCTTETILLAVATAIHVASGQMRVAVPTGLELSDHASRRLCRFGRKEVF